jgi:uncharacterized protein (DUF169 family)
LPKAEQINTTTMSLGCIGARTYTDLPQNEMLLVIPAQQFREATDRLAVVADANEKLAGYHSQQRRTITGA